MMPVHLINQSVAAEYNRARYVGETLPAGFASLPPAALRAARETAPTFSLRTRLVDIQSSSVQFRAIKRADGLIRLSGVAHFHKCKPTGATSVTIRHQVYAIHGAITFKQGPDGRFPRVESKVANKNVFQNHSPSFLIEQLNEAGFDGPGFCGTIKS
jgi:hypothetical protein